MKVIKSAWMLLNMAFSFEPTAKVLHDVAVRGGIWGSFFQLAFECDAKPRDLFKEELVAYVEQYSLCSDATKQVLICYGIIEDVQESKISMNSDASGVCESPYACNVPVEHSIREQVNESGP